MNHAAFWPIYVVSMKGRAAAMRLAAPRTGPYTAIGLAPTRPNSAKDTPRGPLSRLRPKYRISHRVGSLLSPVAKANGP